jgi:hypothetical protein
MPNPSFGGGTGGLAKAYPTKPINTVPVIARIHNFERIIFPFSISNYIKKEEIHNYQIVPLAHTTTPVNKNALKNVVLLKVKPMKLDRAVFDEIYETEPRALVKLLSASSFPSCHLARFLPL